MESLLTNAGTVSKLQTMPQLYANMLGNTENVLWVLDKNAKVLIEINPPGLPVPPPADHESINFTTGQDEASYRLASYQANIGNQKLTLVAGKTLTERNHMLAGYRSTLWWALFLAAGTSASLGWLISRVGLRPVRRLSDNVARIRVSNLDKRLDQVNQYPELKQLTDRLNEMIARLEAGFTELSRFSEDLAHEMRTPLNTLIGQSQQCLCRPRTMEDYETLVLSNLEEHERLSRMINSMLFLARAEQAKTSIQLEQVSISSRVAGLFDYFADIAEERSISLKNDTTGVLYAAPDLLQRALANLLDNALRHTQEGGIIRISCHHDAGSVVLNIFNSGEHIEAAHIPRLFDRFYRCDPARHNSHETGGLGLAIVASIMKGHGGSAKVGNLQDGVNVSLTFPAQTEQAANLLP